MSVPDSVAYKPWLDILANFSSAAGILSLPPLIADKASMTRLLRHVYQTLDADADVSVQTLHLKDLETREPFWKSTSLLYRRTRS